MKQHLQISADAGRSDAQLIFRQLFGRMANVSKEVKLVEEGCDDNKGKGKDRPRAR